MRLDFKNHLHLTLKNISVKAVFKGFIYPLAETGRIINKLVQCNLPKRRKRPKLAE
jgi:hypothetical protein